MSKFTIDNNSINSFSSNMKLPTPPKKGEKMYCQICGKEILPEHFSKNQIERKREFKWQIHHDCFLEIDAMIDRSMPGLLAERKQRK